MNHTYQPSLTNKSQCGICKYDFVSHTKFAHCESCPNIGECDFIDSSPDILMCESCQTREYEIQMELLNRSIGPKPTPDNARLNELSELSADESVTNEPLLITNLINGYFESTAPVSQLSNQDRITELTNRLSKELPVDARSFHVKEVSSIVSIEQELALLIPDKDERAFKLAELVSERLESFKKNLFEVKKLEAELRVDMITDQRYLNLLVPSLRAAEREKFKSYDLTYQPVIKPVQKDITPKVRQSASDKAFESFAKMMGISVEQAKKAMTSVLNEKGITCSCQETPGLCKVHPS